MFLSCKFFRGGRRRRGSWSWSWSQCIELCWLLCPQSINFTIHRHRDLDLVGFRKCVERFVTVNKTGPRATMVVYFAGHGCEALLPDGSSASYLIPVDELGVLDFHLPRTAVSVPQLVTTFGKRRCVATALRALLLRTPMRVTPLSLPLHRHAKFHCSCTAS